MRLIDAEALKEKLVREHNALDGDDAMREGLVYAYMCIDEAPTAPIPEAKWELDGDCTHCTACNTCYPVDTLGRYYITPYCPTCGARMKEIIK